MSRKLKNNAATAVKCPWCGAKNAVVDGVCRECGFDWSDSSQVAAFFDGELAVKTTVCSHCGRDAVVDGLCHNCGFDEESNSYVETMVGKCGHTMISIGKEYQAFLCYRCGNAEMGEVS